MRSTTAGPAKPVAARRGAARRRVGNNSELRRRSGWSESGRHLRAHGRARHRPCHPSHGGRAAADAYAPRRQAQRPAKKLPACQSTPGARSNGERAAPSESRACASACRGARESNRRSERKKAADRMARGREEPTKYWLSTLRQKSFATGQHRQAALAHRARLQDLKQEVGLGHRRARMARFTTTPHYASRLGFLISERETIPLRTRRRPRATCLPSVTDREDRHAAERHIPTQSHRATRCRLAGHSAMPCVPPPRHQSKNMTQKSRAPNKLTRENRSGGRAAMPGDARWNSITSDYQGVGHFFA